MRQIYHQCVQVWHVLMNDHTVLLILDTLWTRKTRTLDFCP